MARILFFLISITVCLQLGCSEATQPTAKGVFVLVEVESDFQNDLVSILLDNKTLLESRITTNYVLSLAWSSGFLKLSNDSHSLYFSVVEFGVHDGYNINLTNDTSTVAVKFDRSTKQIHFQQYKGRIFRD